jgi:hypothetical protein
MWGAKSRSTFRSHCLCESRRISLEVSLVLTLDVMSCADESGPELAAAESR